MKFNCNNNKVFIWMNGGKPADGLLPNTLICAALIIISSWSSRTLSVDLAVVNSGREQTSPHHQTVLITVRSKSRQRTVDKH